MPGTGTTPPAGGGPATPLTRAEFAGYVERALAVPGRGPLAVIRLRPDDPHFLDDCGCFERDEILPDLSARIASCLGAGDRLAHVGEATYAVAAAADRDAAVRLTREIMFAVEDPSRRPLPFSVIAGVAVAPPPGAGQPGAGQTGAGQTGAGDRGAGWVGADLSVAEPASGDAGDPDAAGLIRQASVALGTVAAAPWRIAVFAPRMLREHSANQRLRTAIMHTPPVGPTADVDVLFEPVVELATEQVVGIAARAAWYDDDTAVSAGRLMAMAGYLGLAERADEFVMQTALASFADWTGRWPGGCRQLWLTISTETLSDAEFPLWLRRLLDDVGIPPSALVVDPLDDLYQGMHGETARRTLREIRTLGVQVTAGNAMALLERPGDGRDERACADYLSISPTAVARCVDDPRAGHLVQAAVELATTHGAATAARQVTTAAQHARLRALGCRVARGPLYGEPLSAGDAGEVIAASAAGTWRPADAAHPAR